MRPSRLSRSIDGAIEGHHAANAARAETDALAKGVDEVLQAARVDGVGEARFQVGRERVDLGGLEPFLERARGRSVSCHIVLLLVNSALLPGCFIGRDAFFGTVQSGCDYCQTSLRAVLQCTFVSRYAREYPYSTGCASSRRGHTHPAALTSPCRQPHFRPGRLITTYSACRDLIITMERA